MRKRLFTFCWIALAILVVGGAIQLVLPSRMAARAQAALARTKADLHQQGFKTDLTDFDLTTSPEMRAREAVLMATATQPSSEPFTDDPNLLAALTNNRVIVVWQEEWLKRQSPPAHGSTDKLTWEDLRAAVNLNKSQIDAACAAILSGPIQFNLNAAAGNAMLLPHLAVLKRLTATLDDRAMLALQDGDRDAAWTNLMAATRLVTSWKTEPAEVSHMVRFADAKEVYGATWQALQMSGWTEDQLGQLQREWEGADFLHDLPEITAFRRASYAREFEQDQPNSAGYFPAFGNLINVATHDLPGLWKEIGRSWYEKEYWEYGHYDDARTLLHFYRDRELEARNAIRAPNWQAMRQLPGVTNKVAFRTEYPSRTSARLRLREMNRSFQECGVGIFGDAAEAETERDILVTAIALKRHHLKYGEYPNTLQALAPEFLPAVPADFMDGQPLRYRLEGQDHFVLYSVGLDGVDNGGKLPTSGDAMKFFWPPPRETSERGTDIVWPLPADVAEVSELRRHELETEAQKAEAAADNDAVSQWERTSRNQSSAGSFFIIPAPEPPGLNYHGQPMSVALSANKTGTNRPSLAELLTLHQITTGDEPEDITFEIPVNYDVVTNLGELLLCVDANPQSAPEIEPAQEMDLERSDDGKCHLVWSTLYESRGKHALHAALGIYAPQFSNPLIEGPITYFTITNLCQFSISSATFDPQTGATWRARLPESNGLYTIDLATPEGKRLKTITGSTTNGVIKVHWDLIDDQGQRFTNDSFDSVFHINLPDSVRSQTLNGP